MTRTVLFGEKIPNIKPKRHLRAAVILSAEMIPFGYTRASLHEVFKTIQFTYHACLSGGSRRKLKYSEVNIEFYLQRFNFALTEAHNSERLY